MVSLPNVSNNRLFKVSSENLKKFPKSVRSCTELPCNVRGKKLEK